jgi:hypothetical protein
MKRAICHTFDKLPFYIQLERVIFFSETCLNIDDGKAIPLEAWTDPEGFRRLGLPDFKTIGP